MVAKLKVDQLETVDGTGIITVNNPLAGDGSNLTGVGVAGISSSADATAITINSSEQVGIGTGSPTSPLHVLASSAGQTVAKFESNQAGAVAVEIDAGADRDSFLRFQEAGTTRWDFWAQGSSGTNELNIRNESGTNLIQFKQDGRGLSQFTAKAWVTYNHETPTISDSHNISSVTDRGSGKGTLNFSNSLGNTSYCVVGNALDGGGENDNRFFNHSHANTYTASAFDFYTGYTANTSGGATLQDASIVSVVVFGD